MKRFIALVFFLSSPAHADGDVAQGAKLYQGSCMACHGVKADGNGPAAAAMKPAPTNFRSAVYWKDRTDEQIAVAIKSGSPGTPMMPFTHLGPQQVADLVAFLRAQAPAAEPKSGPAQPPSAPKGP